MACKSKSQDRFSPSSLSTFPFQRHTHSSSSLIVFCKTKRKKLILYNALPSIPPFVPRRLLTYSVLVSSYSFIQSFLPKSFTFPPPNLSILRLSTRNWIVLLGTEDGKNRKEERRMPLRYPCWGYIHSAEHILSHDAGFGSYFRLACLLCVIKRRWVI